MRRKPLSLLLSAVLLLGAGNAFGALVVNRDATGPYTSININTVSAWDTTGHEMDGMAVTVTGTDSNGAYTQTYSWNDLSGASGNDWSLFLEDMSGSTITGLWKFEISNADLSVNNILIEGLGHNVVFDALNWDEGPVPFPDPGWEASPGSKAGRIFELSDETTYDDTIYDITADYLNPIGLGSEAPAGDLFGSLSISFDPNRLLAAGDTFSFYIDTDNLNTPVPEPATMILLGTGLLGLAGLKRRKK